MGDHALSILVVEDHDDSRNALARLLERQGYVVSVARTMAEAFAAAADADLAICDLGLPDGDGCDLMAALRDVHDIPGIAVSGYIDDAYHRRAVAAGFCVHLFKPITFAALVEAIEKCSPPPTRPRARVAV